MGVVASITEITINSHGPGAGTVPICFYFSGCEDLTGISRMGKVLYPIEDTRLLKGPVSGYRLIRIHVMETKMQTHCSASSASWPSP